MIHILEVKMTGLDVDGQWRGRGENLREGSVERQ